MLRVWSVNSILLFQGLVLAQDLLNLAHPDICPLSGSQQINITDTYLSLYLDGREEQTLPRKCTLHLSAPLNHGLMVYIEDMYLRGGGEQGCVDTVQFGVEDKIPFVTFKKTKKLCGALTDWSWDVEDGGLIIWLNLEKNRPEYHRETFPVVKLKIVITQYKKHQEERYESCSTKHRFIPKQFFCDGEINCPLDPGPRDESPDVCMSTTVPPTQPSSPPTITEFTEEGGHDEDLRLKQIIIIVSLGVLVILAYCVVVCVRQMSGVPESSSPRRSDCQSIRLSGLPISENRESRRSGTERGVELSTIQRTPEEIRPVSHTPPPAYDDIFPKEYVYNINTTNSSSE